MKSTQLSTAAKQRGLVVLLIDTFLMWGGFFMVIPLISVNYVDKLGWAATSVGLVLGLRQLTQQGLTVFGGALADRVGAKGLIWMGMCIRTVGFAMMAWATTFPLLLISSVVAALGGALFDSPRMAAITALTDETNRSRFFSLAGVVGGLGMTVGPLAGSLLIKTSFSLVALIAAGCFLVACIATVLFLPSVQVSTERGSLGSGIGMALRDQPFVILTILSMGFWFMWVQLTISLPLVAQTISGTSDAVGWIYALNSGMTVLLQYPLLRLAERWLRPLPILTLGTACMAVGLGFVAIANTLPTLLLCVAVFSIGALLAMPSHQTVTASYANPAALGSYFGVSSLALAIGGGLGNVTGGFLYDWGLQVQMPSIIWLVACAVGLAAAIGLELLLERRKTVTLVPHAVAEERHAEQVVATSSQR